MAAKSRNNSWGWTSASGLAKALAMKATGRLAEVRVHLGKSAALPKAWAAEFPTGAGSGGYRTGVLGRPADRRQRRRTSANNLLHVVADVRVEHADKA